jgi:hypothetical protein
VLRGVIHPDSLRELQIDPHYQREFLSPATRRSIIQALNRRERLPDLELGMRGQNWGFVTNNEHPSEVIELLDPVYLIDGQQRRGSILEYLARFPEEPVRQGVAIHFATTMEWERERFQALNLNQTRVSSSLLLRNLRSTNQALATLYGLTNNQRDFPLYDRVTWGQSPARSHLLTAHQVLQATCYFHSHIVAGRHSGVSHMAASAERQANVIGLAVYRANITTFWETLDQVWGVRTLSRKGAAWLKTGFLQAFCSVLSEHRNFWESKTLQIPYDIREKLKKFPIDDPEIVRLAAATGASIQTLEFQLINHINSGRTLHRLEKHNPYPETSRSLRVVGE